MNRLLALTFLMSVPGVASAAALPLIAPAPAWVVAAALPSDTEPADDAAVRILLAEQQLDFANDGIAAYTRSVLRAQTPQGLSTLGSIALAWNPDTDTLIVHHLRIRRGDKVIEVVTKPSDLTVLRRETNLERASLDGVLTATVQAEGMAVGDILDTAVTIIRRDPTLGAHAEQMVAIPPGITIARQHLAARWPKGKPLQWQALDMPVPMVRGRDGTSVTLTATALQPFVRPEGAPIRYQLGRQVQFSDFRDWNEVASLFVPLYAKARALPAASTLRAEINRIRALTPDPRLQTGAALTLVQDSVRYLYVGMNNGNLVPADAELTWTRRYGDCKGKTALLLAVLDGLGIAAEPALVSSVLGDGLDERLPGVGLFDHVIVKVKIAGKTYWLDGTRLGDTNLDRLVVPGFGWALPVRPATALERLVVMAPDVPDSDTIIRIDARKGITLPAPFRVEQHLTGDAATAFNLQLATLPVTERDRTLQAYWRSEYDFVDIAKVSSRFEPAAGILVLAMDGSAKMDWNIDDSTYYELDGASLGWRADFKRSPGSNARAPYAVDFPHFIRTTETILLPGADKGFKLEAPDVDQTIAGRRFRRQTTLEAGTLTMQASTRSLAAEFPAADANAAQAALRELSKPRIYVDLTTDYEATAAENDAIIGKPATTVTELTWRAMALVRVARITEARVELEKALRLEPKALAAARLLASLDFEGAGRTEALKRLLVVDPDNSEALYHLARSSDVAAAPAQIARLDALIVTHPDDSTLWMARAELHRRLKNDDAALADARRATAIAPADPEPYLLRANVFTKRRDLMAVAREADALIAANPDGSRSTATASALYYTAKRPVEGRRWLDRTLELDPSSSGFAARAGYRLPEERAAALLDLAAAIKMNPDDPQIVVAQVKLFRSAPNAAAAAAALQPAPLKIERYIERAAKFADAELYSAAVADLTAALAREPGNIRARADRALSYAYLKDAAAMNADLKVVDAAESRNIVAMHARGVLADGTGDYPAAIAAFSRAIARNEKDAFALGNRAGAYYAIGDSARALVDASAAIKVWPRWTYMYTLRAEALQSVGNSVGARAEAAAIAAARPHDIEGRSAAARIYLLSGDRTAALREYAAALAIQPDARTYVKRAALRPGGDSAGRLADFETALKLDPRLALAISGLANERSKAGNHAAAIDGLNAALVITPKDTDVLTARGIAHELAGDPQQGARDFAFARSLVADVPELNRLCWTKATRGVGLISALEDCDAALKQRPDALDVLDSRALVLLRLGRIDEAIADYSRVIAKRPTLWTSLYARAIAFARRGDLQSSKRDSTAALVGNPDLAAEFEGYGLTLTP